MYSDSRESFSSIIEDKANLAKDKCQGRTQKTESGWHNLCRNLIALLAFLWVPMCFGILVALPMLLAPSSSLGDAMDICEDYRTILHQPDDRTRRVVIEQLPPDLSTGYSLERTRPGRGQGSWIHVARENSSWWFEMGLTHEWVLTYITDEVFEQQYYPLSKFLPYREGCTNKGWGDVGPVCAYVSLQEMGPAGILAYMNATMREKLPVTAAFSLPPASGERHVMLRFVSHYLSFVIAGGTAMLGSGLVNLAQLRGRVKRVLDCAVFWYFFMASMGSLVGGLGAMGLNCYTEESVRQSAVPFLYLVVCLTAMISSNILLQWILVLKMETVGKGKSRILRLALRGEHLALVSFLASQMIFTLNAVMIQSDTLNVLALGITNLMIFCVMLADIVFSVFAILAYVQPLLAVRKSLREARSLERSSSSEEFEVRNLQRAYRVAFLNLAATIVAVCSTTTSYVVWILHVLWFMMQDIPVWSWDYHLRIAMWDAVVNDICTIIFADLIYLNFASEGSDKQQTLWAISHVGVHAAMRQQQHEEQQRELTESLNALAKGRDPVVLQEMLDLELELREVSLEKFKSRSGDAPGAERVFNEMQTTARAELQRLMALVTTIIKLYQHASTRFEYLLEIENGPLGEQDVEQEVPAWLREPNSEDVNSDENNIAMRYLYQMADFVAPEFHHRASMLIKAFNAAIYPADLGLDPDKFHFRIFVAPEASARLTWGPKKTEARGWQKVRSDYAKRRFPQAASLLDVERMMLSFPDPYALAVFFAFLVQDGSLPVVRVKNRFLSHNDMKKGDTGHDLEYRDVLLNVKVKGLIVEIQLALQNLAELKSCMHPFYKLERAQCYEDVVSQAIFARPHDVTSASKLPSIAQETAAAALSMPMPSVVPDDGAGSRRRRNKGTETSPSAVLPGCVT